MSTSSSLPSPFHQSLVVFIYVLGNTLEISFIDLSVEQDLIKKPLDFEKYNANRK